MFLVGSKSNVSAVFWLRFRMVWALFLSLFNGFQQRRFGIFPATVSQWLGHKTCWGFAFSHARPKHLFLEFGLVACRLPKSYVAQRFALLEATFFFVFSRFQKQRFGSFLAAVSHGLGTISGCGFAWFGHIFSFFLMGSNSDVSAFFRLRFRNGLGTKPAARPKHLFLSWAWWLERRFGIFPAAVSQWLGHKTCWGSAFSHARPKHLFLEFGLVACRLPSLTLRKGLPCLRQPFFLVFSRFQKHLFLVLAWWLAGFQVLRCAVPCWTQPFATFFFVFSRFQKQRFGSFLAAVSHGLGTILLSF